MPDDLHLVATRGSSMSRGLVLYLHVHQPYRIKPYSVFDIGHDHQYFNQRDDSDTNNEKLFHRVADKSYRPMNALLLDMLERNPDFRLSLSISGVFMDQAERWAPDVIESFRQLFASGRVELVGETYYHSLAFFYSRDEFEKQVAMHRERAQQLFGVTPRTFRNTELAYNDDLAKWADDNDYQAILAEGWDPILEWRKPSHVYKPAGTKNIKLLLKNYRLSDDIAFRFSNQGWSQYPLTPDKFLSWTDAADGDGDLVNLFMDYETFGEHQWADTGIFDFFSSFLTKWPQERGNRFHTVSEAATSTNPAGEIRMPQTVTWADSERDLSAWTGNAMQQEIAKYLYALEDDVTRSGDDELIADWRNLQTSDHLYYLSTKWLDDGDVHTYFSPYGSPYDAFMYYMNAIRDIRWRVMKHHRLGGLDG